MRSSIGKIVALVVTGFGIGWLAGLSVSPVVSIVITSVTGSVATIVAALSGVKDELLDRETSPNTVRRWLRGVTPVPLAWLVVGLILGASGGVWVRTHDKLGQTPSSNIEAELKFWQKATGLSENILAQQMFNRSYPLTTSNIDVKPANDNTPPYQQGVLFSISERDCTAIEHETGATLLEEMETAGNLQLVQIAEMITDTAVLERMVKEVLCVKR